VFVNSGVARGSGWQHIVAYVNLPAYYLCGIPIAIVLGFFTKLKGKGLWIGIQIGVAIQTIMLSIIICCTNWEKQVYTPLLCLDALDFGEFLG
jgi:MATE family multidrug resistance protein